MNHLYPAVAKAPIHEAASKVQRARRTELLEIVRQWREAAETGDISVMLDMPNTIDILESLAIGFADEMDMNYCTKCGAWLEQHGDCEACSDDDLDTERCIDCGGTNIEEQQCLDCAAKDGMLDSDDAGRG